MCYKDWYRTCTSWKRTLPTATAHSSRNARRAPDAWVTWVLQLTGVPPVQHCRHCCFKNASDGSCTRCKNLGLKNFCKFFFYVGGTRKYDPKPPEKHPMLSYTMPPSFHGLQYSMNSYWLWDWNCTWKATIVFITVVNFLLLWIVDRLGSFLGTVENENPLL